MTTVLFLRTIFGPTYSVWSSVIVVAVAVFSSFPCISPPPHPQLLVYIRVGLILFWWMCFNFLKYEIPRDLSFLLIFGALFWRKSALKTTPGCVCAIIDLCCVLYGNRVCRCCCCRPFVLIRSHRPFPDYYLVYFIGRCCLFESFKYEVSCGKSKAVCFASTEAPTGVMSYGYIYHIYIYIITHWCYPSRPKP